MHLVRILVLLNSAGADQGIALLLVHPENILHMESPFGQVADQGAVAAIEVQVGPSVAFRPVDEFPATVDEFGSSVLDVGPFPFRDDGSGRVGADVHTAQVQPLEIPALAHEVETLAVTQPPVCPVVEVSVSSRGLCAQQRELLVLEGFSHDIFGGSPVCSLVEIEYVEVSLRSRFARHLVLVGLEFRTLPADRIDHPEFLKLPCVPFHRGEMLRVR